MNDTFFISLTTLGPIGFLPGSGTWASLMFMPLVILCYANISLSMYNSIIFIVCIISFILIKQAQSFFKCADPSYIVLDEMVACFFLPFGLSLTFQNIGALFILFRIFDISKMLGIKYLERLPGPWGVMSDDIAAAVLANIICNIFSMIIIKVNIL